MIGKLPYVHFNQRSELPDAPGIYYVVCDETIVYIGRSRNIRMRWASHNKAIAMNASHRIYWKRVPEEELELIEWQEIEEHTPAWNGKIQEGELKSVKVPLSAWRVLTHICATTEESRTKALTRLILEAEKAAQSQQKGNE